MDSAGGGKLRLRRSFPPPPFSQPAVISNGAKRNENPEVLAEGKSLMRQFELHPIVNRILNLEMPFLCRIFTPKFYYVVYQENKKIGKAKKAVVPHK